MAWTNLKSAVAVGVCAVTAATTIVIESRHASKLRAENRRLAAQIGELQKTRANEMAILQPGDSELERLRREAAEVYKLRGEVAQLRRGKDDATKLRAQIDALQSKHEQASLSKDTNDPQPTPAEEGLYE